MNSEQTRTSEPRTARQWLDAVSSGSCDPDSFLRGIEALIRVSEDETWEVLSLLDQYYRRGKLPAELFRTFKAHVDRLALVATPGLAMSTRAAPAPSPPSSPAPPASPPPASPPSSLPLSPSPPSTSPPSFLATAAPSLPGNFPADFAGTRATVRPRKPFKRAPAVGDVLRERYELVGILGRGGMGTVFEAIDRYRGDLPQASRKLAIKVLHAGVSDQPELFDELRSEFHHLQSLSHPNIVRVHELDRDGETAFFTMELLTGAPLSRLFGTQPDGILNRAHALAIIRDVGAAIAHAHSRGVVHGDLNPQNIFITQEGEVRVLDFGASYQINHKPELSDIEGPQQTPATTPSFGSCQLLEGETADVRDDIFAFACVAYILFAGKHPFQSRTALEARSQRLQAQRPIGLSSRQWRALQAGLAFERDRRPSQVQDWLKQLGLNTATRRLPVLADLMAAEPRSDKAPVATTIGAACVVLLALAVWAIRKQDANGSGTEPSSAAAAIPGSTDPAASATTVHAAPARPTPGTAAGVTGGGRGGVTGGLTSLAPAASTASPTSTLAAAAPSVTAGPTAAAQAATAAASTPAGGPIAHIELAEATVDLSPSDTVARVTVRRKGASRGDVSFRWWTESGTAKPGVDFAAVAPRIEHIESGKNSANLLVPIVSDTTRRSAKSFYVLIDTAGPQSGASVVNRSTTIVTVPPIK